MPRKTYEYQDGLGGSPPDYLDFDYYSTGNEQKAKTAAIGAGIALYTGFYAETTLPTNVPVKVRVTFDGVDENVTRLSLLTLGIQPRGASGLPDKEVIQFRNIPLH